MKKIYLFLIFVSIIAFNSKAQVTIGSTNSPTKGAILDLDSETFGLLLPRVMLESISSPNPTTGTMADLKGMMVYNKDPQNLPVGIYYNTGTEWVRILGGAHHILNNWFYLPSFALDAVEGETYNVELFDKYIEQFSTNVISSSSAPTLLVNRPLATDFYYFVVGYDTEVFGNISITAEGRMTYTVIGTPTDATYINIVMAEKHNQ